MKTEVAADVAKDSEETESRWAFMKPKIIGDGRTVYMLRLTLLATPLFGIQLHWIYRPDNQRELHDHPWDFLSIMLRGFYREDTPAGRRERRWFNWKRAEGRHSIRYVSRSPVMTLVFRGRERRPWGFWVPAISRCVCADVSGGHEFGCIARYDPYREVFVESDQYEKLNDA